MKFKEGDEVTGAGLLETITSGLYNDNSNCIREYIQNAIDSLRGIEDQNRQRIELSIENNGNTIRIRDYGVGMNYDELYEALKIGYSTKNIDEDIGWRGVGIYSGVPNFRKIVIATKKDGGRKLVASVNCDKFLELAQSRSNTAKYVLEQAIDGPTEEDDPDFQPGTLISLVELRPGQGTYFTEEMIKFKIIRTVPLKLANSSFKERIKTFLEGVGIAEPKHSLIFKNKDGNEEELFRPIINDDLFDPDSFSHYIYTYKKRPIFAVWTVTAKENKEIEKGSLRSPPPSYKRIHHGLIFKKKLMTIGKSDQPEDTVKNYFNGTYHYWNFGEIHILSKEIRENAGRENFENITEDYRVLVGEIRVILGEIEKVNRQKSSNDKSTDIVKIRKLIEKGDISEAKKLLNRAERALSQTQGGSDHEFLRNYSNILEERRINQFREIEAIKDDIEARVNNNNTGELIKQFKGLIGDKNIRSIVNKIKNPEKPMNKHMLSSVQELLSMKTGIMKEDFVELVREVYGLDNNLQLDVNKIKDSCKLFLIKPSKLAENGKNKKIAIEYSYRINGNIAHMLIATYQLLRNGDIHHYGVFNSELYKRMEENNEYVDFMLETGAVIDFLEKIVKYSIPRSELTDDDLPEL